MKHFRVILVALIAVGSSYATLPARAETPSPITKEELANLYRRVQGWESYRIDFRVVFTSGTEGNRQLEGRYEASGGSFHIATPEVELFSDGTTKWEVNRLYKEITVDDVTAEDRSILADPVRFFEQMGQGMTVEVSSVVPNITPGGGFNFDAARYPDFEVVDFR